MVSGQPWIKSTLFRPLRERLFFRFPWEKGNSNVSKYRPPPNWDGSDIEQPAGPGTVNAGQRADGSSAHTQVLLLTLLAALVSRHLGRIMMKVLLRHRKFQVLSPECLVNEGLGPMRCHNGHTVTQQRFCFSTLALSRYRGFPGSSA